MDEKPVSATGRTVVIVDDDLLLREGIVAKLVSASPAVGFLAKSDLNAEAVAALVANKQKDR